MLKQFSYDFMNRFTDRAGRSWGLLHRQKTPNPKRRFKGNRRRRIAFLSPLVSLKNPFSPPLLASFLVTTYAKCLGSLAFSALSSIFLTCISFIVKKYFKYQFKLIRWVFSLLLLIPIRGFPAWGADATGYDADRWGSNPYQVYDIVPNLEKTTPKETDPYFGPPGHLKNRPKPLPPVKKGLSGYLFGKREDPPPSVPESLIVNVGPRQYASSQEPLLRLDTPLTTSDGITLLPGVYLVHTYGAKIQANLQIENAPTHLSLSMKGKIMLTLPLERVEPASPSPIEQLPPAKPLKQETPELQSVFRRIQVVPASRECVYLLYQIGDVYLRTPKILSAQ